MNIKSIYAACAMIISCCACTSVSSQEKILETYKWSNRDASGRELTYITHNASRRATSLNQYALAPDQEHGAKYNVWVSSDNGKSYEQLDVVLSYGLYEIFDPRNPNAGDHYANFTKQRTMSFAHVSYNDASGVALRFRIEPLAFDSKSATLAPASYGYSAEVWKKSVEFTVDKSRRYISIEFDSPTNRLEVNPHFEGWIKDMLCIFVDPMEGDNEAIDGYNVPQLSDKGVVSFATASAEELEQAKVIYFEPGCYNLTDTATMADKAPIVRTHHEGRIDGRMLIQDHQSVYIAGGAYVEGYFSRTDYNDSATNIYGRGILSGRQHIWQERPYNDSSSKYKIMQMVQSGHNSVNEGITVMESPQHGMVARHNNTYENIKFIGWHCNNDGIRAGAQSIIRNCFIRACDDFFYNYALDIDKCVLWPAFNGSIMTFGWNNIGLGGSTMDNVDIIAPEWTGMGNNKGLIMSQNSFEYPDWSRADQTEFLDIYRNKITTFNNIRIEGTIPGFVNLKPNSNWWNKADGSIRQRVKSDSRTPATTEGISVGIRMTNIDIESMVGEAHNRACNLIEGAQGKLTSGSNGSTIWPIGNIEFENITIGSDGNGSNNFRLSAENYKKYFRYGANAQATSYGITIDGRAPIK